MRNLNSSGCPASCGEWSAKHEASNDAIGQSAAAAAGAAAEKDDRTEQMEGGREGEGCRWRITQCALAAKSNYTVGRIK